MTGPREVARLKRRLDATFARMPSPAADPEVQSDFAKYLCILVCGFLDNAIVALVLDYADRKSAPPVTLFVERSLDRWNNATCEKIVQLMGMFHEEWRLKVEAFLVDEKKEAINSLIGLRNNIAHGGASGVSLAQVKRLYSTTQDVVSFVESLVT